MARITDAERVTSVTPARRRHIIFQYDMGVSQRSLKKKLGLPARTIYAVIKHAIRPEDDQSAKPLAPSEPIDDWHDVISPGWAVHGNMVRYKNGWALIF